MSKSSAQRPKIATNVAFGKQTVLTADEVKTRLKEQGLTLKAWAEKKKYPYDTVSDVVRGVNRATYGLGHRIAIELGMKRG